MQPSARVAHSPWQVGVHRTAPTCVCVCVYIYIYKCMYVCMYVPVCVCVILVGVFLLRRLQCIPIKCSADQEPLGNPREPLENQELNPNP